MNILVYIESSNSKIHPVSLESLAAAQKLKKSNNAMVYAVIFDKSLSDSLASYNLDGIVTTDNDALSNYNPLFYLEAFNQLSIKYNPNLISRKNLKLRAKLLVWKAPTSQHYQKNRYICSCQHKQKSPTRCHGQQTKKIFL